MSAEFDSWYEESFLGGVVNGEAAPVGSATNVPASKAESLAKQDTCVRYLSSFHTLNSLSKPEA